MNKITFENLPNTNTPVNASNLNQMQTNIEKAIETATEVTGDWNTACGNITGFFRGQGLSNAPTGITVDNWWYVEQIVHSATYKKQIAYSYYNNNTYVRNNGAGTWGKWEEVSINDKFTYTQATGTYTTAQWSAGTNTCTWTAPRTGLYILWARFNLQTDTNAKVYKQLQLRGTASRISGDLLLYQDGETDSSTGSNKKGIAIFEGSKLIYAEQGQTIYPYIHTPEAGIVWNITLTGLFLK